MQLVMAIVRPNKLEEVRDSLNAAGILGMTVQEVRGCGRQKGHKELYRGAEYVVDFLPKVLLQTVVADDQVDAAIAAIRKAASTDTIGDGKIFVTPIGRAVRIRTGEEGDEAL